MKKINNCNYKPLFFYLLFLILCLIIILLFRDNKYINLYFNMSLSLKGMLLVFIFPPVMIISDKIFTGKKREYSNIKMIEDFFGKNRTFSYDFLLSASGSFSEELFFRLISFAFLCSFLRIETVYAVILISVLFGVLHITEGAAALILSFLSSVYFFILMFISGSILYPASAHAVFNFIQLFWIMKKNDLPKKAGHS